MKKILVFLCFANFGYSQDVLEWSEFYHLKISDFQSPKSLIGETNSYLIAPSTKMDFSFSMSSYEFMLTKNFNSKVNTSFTRSSSIIIASDSVSASNLVSYAQLNYNLIELYARKYRKNLFEMKGVFSQINFFEKAYENIEKEYNERQVEILQETNSGQLIDKTNAMNNQVIKEIFELNEFCKTCKPKKKKKSENNN